MKLIDPLLEVLGRMGASQGNAVLVNAEELRQWPSAAVEAMKSQKLIVKASPADSALCPGCEDECVMPVHKVPAKEGASSSFIVCDKRSDINRVFVSSERLTQWQCNMGLVCKFVATNLGVRPSIRRTDIVGRWEIGVAFGDKRSQMLCLVANGTLDLVAGNNKVPLAELIDFRDGKYSLDEAMIRDLVDTASTADPRHTPSNARREARKLDTQAMYKDWQKEFRDWQKKRPGMSDVWYSQQIAKMEISCKRDSETIRKHMKK
jgi:hypothetical protein